MKPAHIDDEIMPLGSRIRRLYAGVVSNPAGGRSQFGSRKGRGGKVMNGAKDFVSLDSNLKAVAG
jgi:hypothetical protein